jgi:cytochrome c-type biogenesis protein CcmH
VSRCLFVLMFACLLLHGVARAADEPLAFTAPQLQHRYDALLQELRCLVCQNQTLADSHAELAQDLRTQVFNMLEAGHKDSEVIDFMVARYGDFVLYRPPLKSSTWLLWLGPLLLLMMGLAVVIRLSGGRKPAPSALDEHERARLAELLAARDLEP